MRASSANQISRYTTENRRVICSQAGARERTRARESTTRQPPTYTTHGADEGKENHRDAESVEQRKWGMVYVWETRGFRPFDATIRNNRQRGWGRAKECEGEWGMSGRT